MTTDNKILLVKPLIRHSFHAQNIFPPTSLGYLGEILGRERVGYEVLDMSLGYSLHDLYHKIEQYKPSHLGISMFTYQHQSVYQLANQIKSRFPRIQLVAGGPHISTLREEALDKCPSIDYGVVLEGEYTLSDLMKGKDPRDLKGLIYRDDDRIIATGNPDLIDDLDSIGFPKYEKFSLEKYTAVIKLITIVTTRGCPYQCIYCPVGTSIGRKLRYREPESVVEEIRYWYDRDYRVIEIMDDNFTFYPDRVLKICDLIEAENFRDLTLNIPNGVRADKVDLALLQRLKEVGFKIISFGVEAGNNKILKNLKKNETIETIEQSIRWAVEVGLDVRLFFLIGSPGETYRDFEDSLKIAQKYSVSDAYFYNIVPYPKTELFDWINRNNYFIKQPDYYLNDSSSLKNDPLFETPDMTISERKKAFRVAKRLQKSIYRKKIERKLTKFGFLAPELAWLYSSEAVQLFLRRSHFFRKLIHILKKKYSI